MNLKEAAKYGKFLNDMLYIAQSTSTSKDYVRKVTEFHNRSKFNPDDIDEKIEVIPQDKLDIKSNDLIYLAKSLIEEKLRLSLAISKGKSKLNIDWKENNIKLPLDEAISYNKQLRSLITNCDYLNGIKSIEDKQKQYGYKINVEGNQVSYQYEVLLKKEVDFDKTVVKSLSKSLKNKTDKISTLIDQAMTKDVIDFNPLFDVNDTFEEIVNEYVKSK